ncbi:PREDICTED: uncharacterized protein LOC108568490 [Nicrophorus vespilloides]|uniref:Uncharacterized protein LOC108568490 n=1 Tax=Nicrophorus vespilloides TaxID=110193 RepID=A0ABM1NE50_NICVS|nr:PREDICTED: uncharacterized protein LOC108568490 [Nicrophorus vespilloides]
MIMSNHRYVFSEESVSSIAAFKEAVSKNNHHSKLAGKWNHILPQNEELLKRIEVNKKDFVINLEESNQSTIVSTVSIKPIINESNTSNVEYHLNILMQQLKHLDLIPDQTFTEIQSNLTNNQMEELFQLLSRSVHIEDIHKLGKSVAKCVNANDLCVLYSNIIFVKLSEEQSDKITEVLLLLLESYPVIINVQLSKYLVNLKEECPRALQENLKYLKASHKQALLREFIQNCSKLEVAHFPLCELLINEQLDQGAVKKFVNMLTKSSMEYNGDKNFGKLLLQVIVKVGNIVKYFEDDFRSIIKNHRSPWKVKLTKTFENAINSFDSVNETMHF